MSGLLIFPIPQTEWIQDKAHAAFRALNLGPVIVEVMRTDEDAVVRVSLPKQTNAKGQTAMSVFRFKAGFGLQDKIERGFVAAAQDLERKIAKQKAKAN